MPRRLIARRPDVSPCTTWGAAAPGHAPDAKGRPSIWTPEKEGRALIHGEPSENGAQSSRGSVDGARAGIRSTWSPTTGAWAHRPSWCTALRAVRGVCALGVIDLEACAGLFSLGPIEAYDVTHASVCGRPGGFRACAGRVPSVRCRGRSAVHPCRALDVVERWCGQARSLLPTMRRTCVPRSHSADTRQLDGLRRSGGLGQPLTTSARLSSDST